LFCPSCYPWWFNRLPNPVDWVQPTGNCLMGFDPACEHTVSFFYPPILKILFPPPPRSLGGWLLNHSEFPEGHLLWFLFELGVFPRDGMVLWRRELGCKIVFFNVPFGLEADLSPSLTNSLLAHFCRLQTLLSHWLFLLFLNQ